MNKPSGLLQSNNPSHFSFYQENLQKMENI